MEDRRVFEKAARAIVDAEAMLITAGAGLGVDSGLPDFRGIEGFWKAYPQMAKFGLSFIEMANPEWFHSDPHLAWGFYGHRYNLYRSTTPHSGFERLLGFAAQMPAGYFVFTSNVDGHFQKAGFNDAHIVECHGSINFFQCSRPCSGDIWSADRNWVPIDGDSFQAAPPLPKCSKCGGVARPNILMFGDWSWISSRTDRQETRFHNWLREIVGARVVVLEAGAGCAIPTVRNRSESLIRTHGATLIRINTREHHVPVGQLSISSGAAGAIESICHVTEKWGAGQVDKLRSGSFNIF